MTSILMPSATAFTSSSFYLETNTQTFESPLNRVTQRLELPGQRWRTTLSLPPMTRAQAAPWIAFFLTLKGAVNTFMASDPDWQQNLGAWSGVPKIKGSGQTGNSLLLDGCNTNVAGWARAGDYFNLASKLYRMTADANSNGSGEVTLHFEPPIYHASPDDLAVTVNPATVEMRLLDDSVGDWSSDKNGIYQGKTFSAVEVL